LFRQIIVTEKVIELMEYWRCGRYGRDISMLTEPSMGV
jgi:hypothetical protein